MMKTVGEIAQWPVGVAATGVASPAGVLATHGPVEQTLAVASITKPMVAYAVLIAIEEGTLGFDEPVGPPGSTVSHLLGHASGLGPENGDATTAVASRRIYSNAGYELLGDFLAEKAGMSVAAYLHEAVFAPLGMTGSELRGSPAHAAFSTVSDLLQFGRELLHPTLISIETQVRATTPFLAELSGVLPGFGRQDPNTWGLGFEIRGTKAPHWTGALASPETFGHFGRLGGFLWVDPTRQLTAATLTDTEFGAWAAELWPGFNDRLLQECALTPGAE